MPLFGCASDEQFLDELHDEIFYLRRSICSEEVDVIEAAADIVDSENASAQVAAVSVSRCSAKNRLL